MDYRVLSKVRHPASLFSLSHPFLLSQRKKSRGKCARFPSALPFSYLAPKQTKNSGLSAMHISAPWLDWPVLSRIPPPGPFSCCLGGHPWLPPQQGHSEPWGLTARSAAQRCCTPLLRLASYVGPPLALSTLALLSFKLCLSFIQSPIFGASPARRFSPRRFRDPS